MLNCLSKQQPTFKTDMFRTVGQNYHESHIQNGHVSDRGSKLPRITRSIDFKQRSETHIYIYIYIYIDRQTQRSHTHIHIHESSSLARSDVLPKKREFHATPTFRRSAVMQANLMQALICYKTSKHVIKLEPWHGVPDRSPDYPPHHDCSWAVVGGPITVPGVSTSSRMSLSTNGQP